MKTFHIITNIKIKRTDISPVTFIFVSPNLRAATGITGAVMLTTK